MPFASHLAMSIAFFLSILPAVFLVFMTLKEYDEYYEDKHFFFNLVLGLFAGIMSSVIYYWSIVFFIANQALTILISLIVGLAIYELLIFSIVLLMKRFNAKYDITYYGVVLGGAFAGLLGMFSIYIYLRTFNITPAGVLSMVLLIITLPMIYISMGAMIGFGIHKGDLFGNSLKIIGIKSIFNILFILWFIGFFYLPPDHGWEWMFFGFIFAGAAYYYTYQTVLPGALPEHLSKHLRRKKRKEKKK
ncbi:hypothetical protein [[Eubacterium] cellulosolvens]